MTSKPGCTSLPSLLGSFGFSPQQKLLLFLAALALCPAGLAEVVLPSSGLDLGQQINAAAADLPTSGGTIRIQPSPNGDCYSFSTPIVLLKAIVLKGDGPATCISYTGTGTAVTFAGNSPSFIQEGSFPDGFGLRDLTLRGAGIGANQTGLMVGDHQYSVGFYGSNLTIANFGLGLQFGHGVWNFKIEHSVFALNGQSVHWASSLHFGGENLDFDHVTFVGAKFADSVEFNDNTNSDFSNLNNLSLIACNFDSAQLVINNGSGSIRIYSPHFENAGVGSGTEPLVRIRAFTAATDVLIDGPDFYNDQSTPYPPSFIEIDGGPTVTISQMRSVNLDGTANVPTNVLIAGDAYVSLLGDAPLRAAKTQYVVTSGNPHMWVMGGQDIVSTVESPTPMMYSQTGSSTDAAAPVVQIGGTDQKPTMGLNLWSGVGNTFYGAQIKEPSPAQLDFCFSGPNALGTGQYTCNASVVNGVFRSTVPDGTAPLSVTSHTPPDNLNAWPATYAPDGTQLANTHITTGKLILPSSGVGVVPFMAHSQFNQSPQCSLSYQTSGQMTNPRPLSSNPYPNQLVIFGQPYIGVYYICVGE